MHSQDNKFEKIISLLYHIANTQSQPKIDHLADFYKMMYANTESLDSFKSFVTLINPKAHNKINYDALYNGMKSQSGWGNKTAALFTKSIFHLHNKNYPSQLKLWEDTPSCLENDDSFYLPVDAVIIAILKYLNNQNWSFDTINRLIKANYVGNEIEVWDDLWFWGFITQSGSGDNRTMEWNINKYWTLRESDKDPGMITEIQSKAEEFLEILKNEKIKIDEIK